LFKKANSLFTEAEIIAAKANMSGENTKTEKVSALFCGKYLAFDGMNF
jgi:hypothetical protein